MLPRRNPIARFVTCRSLDTDLWGIMIYFGKVGFVIGDGLATEREALEEIDRLQDKIEDLDTKSCARILSRILDLLGMKPLI